MQMFQSIIQILYELIKIRVGTLYKLRIIDLDDIVSSSKAQISKY